MPRFGGMVQQFFERGRCLLGRRCLPVLLSAGQLATLTESGAREDV